MHALADVARLSGLVVYEKPLVAVLTWNSDQPNPERTMKKYEQMLTEV